MLSLKSIRTSALALAALCLGISLADVSSAQSIECSGAGCRFSIDTLHLGEAASNRSIPSSAMLGSLLSGRGCSVSNGRFSCVDRSPSPARGSVNLGQLQLGSSRFLDELRSETRYAAPTRDQGSFLPGRGTANPIPEPSAALIFAAGMLVASGLVKRTGSIE